MNVQDIIAAAIALSAAGWLFWRIRNMMGSSSKSGSGGSCGCSKCAHED